MALELTAAATLVVSPTSLSSSSLLSPSPSLLRQATWPSAAPGMWRARRAVAGALAAAASASASASAGASRASSKASSRVRAAAQAATAVLHYDRRGGGAAVAEQEDDSDADYYAQPNPERDKASLIVEVLDELAKAAAVLRKDHQADIDDVLIVDTVDKAAWLIKWLTGTQLKDAVHAWDVEIFTRCFGLQTTGIDPRAETPVGHGRIICLSMYCGKIGSEVFRVKDGSQKARVWIDCLQAGTHDTNQDMLNVLKPYFENPNIKKIWHNYGFDRHILQNHGITPRGFSGDTMHMARLYDSSRRGLLGYSLESLSSCKELISGHDDLWVHEEMPTPKIPMKTLFGRFKLKKDGTDSKVKELPSTLELQILPMHRSSWINYSARDTQMTWLLHEGLKVKLQRTKLPHTPDMHPFLLKLTSLYDVYERFWRPFGNLLTEMEHTGIYVDQSYLKDIEAQALADQEMYTKVFRNWVAQYCPDARFMNAGSEQQLRTLFFAGAQQKSAEERDENGNVLEPSIVALERTFKVPNVDGYIEPGREGKPPKKQRPITLRGIVPADRPIVAELFTPKGWPAVSGVVMQSLAGKDPGTPHAFSQSGKYGKAYDAFGGGDPGAAACKAIQALCQISSINTLLSNFILALQARQETKLLLSTVDTANIPVTPSSHRMIGCTARLTSIQKLVACQLGDQMCRTSLLWKKTGTRFAVHSWPQRATRSLSLIMARQAAVARSPSLVGTLELRILASITNCASMIEAFKAGGDFHSRTAMGMYNHVRKAVDNGDVLLEWDKAKDGPAPKPMLKDAFASERRKAKTLNFSIAYGKTAAGLAKDWKITQEEAMETLELWYRDRPEVRKWQLARKQQVNNHGFVETLLGRRRNIPEAKISAREKKKLEAKWNRDNFLANQKRYHGERAAINTPIQGSAADVVMLAMLEIEKSQVLRDLGFKLLLQIHDEVILEGPEAHAKQALQEVVKLMGAPFDGENILKVDLAVDAKCAKTWFDAK
eukprot:jgi/Chlat1/3497/Chrsp23S03689